MTDKTLTLTDVRFGELRDMVGGDLDLDAGWLHVRARVAKNSEEADIPLGDELVADLRAWRAMCGRPGDDAKVYRIPRNLCRVLKKDLAFAGIPYETKDGYLDVHSLRHTQGHPLDQ